MAGLILWHVASLAVVSAKMLPGFESGERVCMAECRCIAQPHTRTPTYDWVFNLPGNKTVFISLYCAAARASPGICSDISLSLAARRSMSFVRFLRTSAPSRQAIATQRWLSVLLC